MKKMICGVLALTILCFTGCAGGVTDNKNDAPENNTVVDEQGWAVPVYEDVNMASFDVDKYTKDENDRIIYNDSAICTKAGIDVSQFQGDIDWDKVASDGIDYVMLRAGFRGYGPSGLIYPDDNFDINYIGAKEAGLEIGVYFFSQSVSVQEAEEEAKFVLDLIKDKEITYPIAFDWEHVDDTSARTENTTPETITECAKAFCTTIQSAGKEAVVYFNCADGYTLLNLQELSDFNFWLAEYTDKPAFYYDYKMWQYTDSGTVDGISGKVDLNVHLDTAYEGVPDN